MNIHEHAAQKGLSTLFVLNLPDGKSIYIHANNGQEALSVLESAQDALDQGGEFEEIVATEALWL